MHNVEADVVDIVVDVRGTWGVLKCLSFLHWLPLRMLIVEMDS